MGTKPDTRRLAQNIFDRVKEIKRRNPELAKKINAVEKDIRERMDQIRKEIKRFPKEDRDLVTIFVINGLQRTCEEIFLE